MPIDNQYSDVLADNEITTLRDNGYSDSDVSEYANHRRAAVSRAAVKSTIAPNTVVEDSIAPAPPKKYVDKDAPDFIPGLLRGTDQMQAMGYGAGALVGKGLKALGAEDIGQDVQDWGMEGYRRNLKEAGEHAKKYSFKDVYTGEAGFGGAIDYVQGTLGELVPSMVEAATGALIGASVGSSVGPGGTVGGGVVGAFAGRTLLKKAINKGVQQAVKKGMGKEAESIIRKAVTKQALKKLGGKIGMGAAVMPMETGGMYAGLLEEKGIDAPETAMLFGALATAMEYAGGNSKLVGTFIDALGDGGAGMVKKSAKELLTNIPQEALQEGGQEVMGILNTVINTDEKLFTIENLEKVAESMGAGAVGGGAGAVVSTSMNTQADVDSSYEGQLNKKFENIKSNGLEKMPESINALSQEIAQNKQLLQNEETIQALADEAGYEVDDLKQFMVAQNEFKQELVNRLDAELQTPVEQDAEQAVAQDAESIEAVIANQQAKAQAELLVTEGDIDQTIADDDIAQALTEQPPEIVSQDGKPFQSAQELEAHMAELPDASEYTITQTQDGFIGVKKVLDDSEASPFTDEQQVGEQGQVDDANQVLSTEDLEKQLSVNKQQQEQSDITMPEAGAEFETTDQPQAPTKVSLPDIESMFPKQQVVQAEDGSVGVKFKNGKGVTFKSIQDAGQGYIKMAIETGQMSENGKILGITVGNEVLLDANYADDQTMWHENKHVLDNLGMVTESDNSALNAEFNKLRKSGRLGFELSTHEDSIQRMKENRANMFAQVMTDRSAYRGDSKFKAMIQRVMDFMKQMLAFGQQSVTGLAREVESGKLYERQATEQQATEQPDSMFKLQNDSVAKQALAGMLNKKTDINTPEFTEWFDQSVAKKADGNPLEFYHGTDQVFEVFSKDETTNTGHVTTPLGHFFTLKKGIANAYGQHTLPVYLKMNKPYKMSLEEAQSLPNQGASEQRQQELRDAGYDSIVMATGANPYIVVFDSGQVKSVYNQGDFKSPENIYFETRESVSLDNVKGYWSDKDIEYVKNPTTQELISYLQQVKMEQQAQGIRGDFDVLRYVIDEKTGDAYFWDSIPIDHDGMSEALKVSKGDSGFVKSVGHINAMIGDPYFRKNYRGWNDALASSEQDINFEVREQQAEPGEQKFTDKQYDDAFKEKNNYFQNIMQTVKIRGHDAKLLADKLAGAISTRLKNINPDNPVLMHKMRQLDFDTGQNIMIALEAALPLLEKTKKTSLLDRREKMTPADKHAWDLSRKQADTVKIKQIAERYGMTEDMEKLRTVLDDIRQQARNVGYDVGFIDEYWPRIIKDVEGFLQKTQGISEHPVFTEALKDKAKQMGVTVEDLNESFPDVRADLISNMILGQGSGIGGPGNIKGRVFEEIPKGLEKFYMDSDAALMQYIYSMTKKIEARKFFGKVPPKIQAHKQAVTQAQAELKKLNGLDPKREVDLNDLITLHEAEINKFKSQRDYTENIGAYIAELMITGDLNKKDESIVRDILSARFNEHGTTGFMNAYKNLAYIDVMGNPISALTQIGDLAWAAYVGKAWTPKGFSRTIKNGIAATMNKSKMTKEDLGLERIAQEFADGTTLGQAVSKVFIAVGLTKMDSIGKEVLINNALQGYQEQVKSPEGIKALEKKIRPIFGVETKQVIKDLATGTHSQNVKMLVYSRLLDFQPAALSEMSEQYLKAGNGRIFYMLKTYTLKQMDVFRNEVYGELKSGDPKRIAQGTKNMVALLSMLTLANAGADELKDFALGKETSFKDNVIENFLTLGGASRYMQMQVTREGFGSAMLQKILPPAKFVDSISSDVRERVVTGDVEKGLRSLDSVPLLGKLAYWHYGRGAQIKKTVNEKDFSKASKQFRKFKKQFEKSDNKRLFLSANASEFKQMKLHENFQTSLNGNKATINKLKKLEQTPNVIKRIGQLENQREMFYERYFEVAKTLE